MSVFTGAIGILLLIRLDTQPNYMVLLGILRYLAYPRSFVRKDSDADLLAQHQENLGELPSENETEAESGARVRASIANIMTDKKQKKLEEKLENGEILTDAERNELYEAKQTEAAINAKIQEAGTKKKEKSNKKTATMEELVPFTGISEGFIEYGGKYYGTVIEISPV